MTLRRPLAVHALTSTVFDSTHKTKDMTATVTAADLAAAEVELTSDEQDLVRVLVAAAAAHQTTVRICGGWVRDKALGRVTKDVDIALDNCSGATFAERVVEALAKGLQGGDGRGAALAASSTVGLIAANPEQSKHLETATMRLCGVEVDFVNLRSESYADAGDSRIPTMAFGTPQEDAARRDFTLNALFFNVHTQRIEDLTGRGWEDLRAGLLRTPLEPRVTLLDDPLRALRGVRFASRYGFALDPGFAEACLLPEVRAALLTKVSRERVGKEVWGALGTSPAGAARAVDELRRLQLASATFRGVGAAELAGAARGPDGSAVALDAVYATDADDTGGPWLLAARCCAALAAGEAQTAAEPLPTRNATLAALACALLPLTDPGCEALDRRRRPTPLPQVVCKEGLKLPGRTATDARRVRFLRPHMCVAFHNIFPYRSSTPRRGSRNSRRASRPARPARTSGATRASCSLKSRSSGAARSASRARELLPLRPPTLATRPPSRRRMRLSQAPSATSARSKPP